MEEPAAATVVDLLPAEKPPPSLPEVKRKKRKSSDFQVTAFQPPMAMPDLLDPQPTSEPVSSDDTSPSSFLGTPYSTTLQFDYPFPISNEPRDPTVPPTPLPSALPIASSIASAPSLVTAAVASEESSEHNMASPLLSTIAANPDLPVNVNLGELRALPNQSSSSLNSTHSGHTAPILIPVAPSGASGRSVSPPSSLKLSSTGPPMTAPITSPPTHGQRQKGRHSLSIFPIPPPPISMHTNVQIPVVSPSIQVRRPKASTSNSTNSIASDLSTDSTSPPNASRPTSTSLSSISLASLSLLSGPNEPPIPPSLLNKLNNRPRNTSTNSNTTSYFSPNVGTHKPLNSRDFFGSPGVENPSFISAPNSPPTNTSTDSSSDIFKPSSPPSSKSPFSSFRPQLGRSNSSNTHSTRGMSRPFFMRSSTTTNSQLQSRAYAQHLRHQQEQQLKLQEEQQKKKAEKKEKKKLRRSSLSLSRSASSSSSSSIMTRNSSKSKSPTSSSSQTDGFKLSPSSSSAVESTVEESEGSVSPEGTKLRRRRSSVRKVLEKTGSLVGFNLHLNTSKRGGHH